MTVATKTRQKLGPDLSGLEFKTRLARIVAEFRDRHEQLGKAAPAQLLRAKQRIADPDRLVQLER